VSLDVLSRYQVALKSSKNLNQNPVLSGCFSS
jgi:hypothetical protein